MVIEEPGRQPARNLASSGSAHAVGHEEEISLGSDRIAPWLREAQWLVLLRVGRVKSRRRGEIDQKETILVVGPLASQVAHRCDAQIASSSVSRVRVSHRCYFRHFSRSVWRVR